MQKRSYYDKKTDNIILLNERGAEYVIELDRLRSPEQFIDWTYHLLEKNWMDGELLKEFFEVSDQAFLQKYGKTVRGKLDCYNQY